MWLLGTQSLYNFFKYNTILAITFELENSLYYQYQSNEINFGVSTYNTQIRSNLEQFVS